ncbi:von Hippel-Lindau-like protein [Argiope bruennichi]|uniref:von Hippel-Lindau-like protein n=1 Tax=Argiope bruennichi TaxID=94029 RepID=UPI0024948EE6|nr:von Hippel-Lindau-like protein [Argiope bruennichi]
MARVQTPGFRSGPSRTPCLLEITNKTERCINIIWLDYFAREVNFGCVKPDAKKTIQSYVGHPWICRDSVTKRRLLLNKETYFAATKSALNGEKKDNLPVLEVTASNPMFTLVDIGAEAVSRLLPSEERLTSMRLPQNVKDLVKLYIKNSSFAIPDVASL